MAAALPWWPAGAEQITKGNKDLSQRTAEQASARGNHVG